VCRFLLFSSSGEAVDSYQWEVQTSMKPVIGIELPKEVFTFRVR
jgi:hypothetical protein